MRTMGRAAGVTGSGLGAVGVDPLQEQVYRYLVREGRACAAAQVAGDLGLSPRAAATVLRALERQNLVIRTDSRPIGFTANPPELALEPLLARRREDLARTRLFARELQRTFSRAAADALGDAQADDLVELVTGDERVHQYQRHLAQGTRQRFEALRRLPPVEPDDEAALAQVVHIRSVYETETLAGTDVATLADERHQARAASGLPVELALFDRRVGLVPVAVPRTAAAAGPDAAPGPGAALVVRPSPLLDALGALFDSVWVRAVPLLSGPDGSAGGAADGVDERTRQVLLLMSDGLKDESIARALGLSRRTVQKSVTAAMAALGARTRFQAALLAGQRGWLRAGPT